MTTGENGRERGRGSRDSATRCENCSYYLKHLCSCVV